MLQMFKSVSAHRTGVSHVCTSRLKRTSIMNKDIREGIRNFRLV